jgi:large subunit ribosomal protein L17
MRHNKQKKILGRVRPQRLALMQNLSESLILHGGIKTTAAKAKALRLFVEPLITKAKTGTLAARRDVLARLHTEKAVKKLFSEVAPKYKERAGGYTRIIKLGYRASDAGETVRIELV